MKLLKLKKRKTETERHATPVVDDHSKNVTTTARENGKLNFIITHNTNKQKA